MMSSTDPLRLLLVCLCVVQQCAAVHAVLVVDQHRVRGRPLRVRGVPLHENGTPVYSCQENMIKITNVRDKMHYSQSATEVQCTLILRFGI